MKSASLLVAASMTLLAPVAFSSAASAQNIIGSGVAPTTASNSTERLIAFGTTAPENGTLVLFTSTAATPELAGIPLTPQQRADINRAMSAAKFSGDEGKTLSLRAIGPYAQILLIGTGSDRSPLAWQKAGGIAARELVREDQPIFIAGAADAAASAQVATGFGLGQYRFDRHRSDKSNPPPHAPVTIVDSNAEAAKGQFESRGRALVDGARLARNLANEPANVIFPESFVAEVRSAFQGVAGVSIEVLDEAAMRKLGMGTLVGVGQGSPRGSRLLMVRYRGDKDAAAPIALVGKGITYDSGGLSLKPGTGMTSMKGDMAGAAATIGAALSLAKSRAPVDIVAVAALAENMPDGNAQRPSDVVRTLSSKTIEMVNSDAEGRLVLADANEYVARQYQPRQIINLATLTGAVVSAVGNHYAGLFTRKAETEVALRAAGDAVGEKLWPLPLDKAYMENLRSDVADIRNSSSSGGPGASLGALFVDHFVPAQIDWAHIDIAGTFRSDKAGPLTPKGMTGYGVRLLDQYVRDAK